VLYIYLLPVFNPTYGRMNGYDPIYLHTLHMFDHYFWIRRMCG